MVISQSLFGDVCSRCHGLKLIVLGTSRNYTKSKFRVSPCDAMRMEWRQGCCPSSPILASPAASAAPGQPLSTEWLQQELFKSSAPSCRNRVGRENHSKTNLKFAYLQNNVVHENGLMASLYVDRQKWLWKHNVKHNRVMVPIFMSIMNHQTKRCAGQHGQLLTVEIILGSVSWLLPALKDGQNREFLGAFLTWLVMRGFFRLSRDN